MAISNIEAVWSSGDLTFRNKVTKAAILKIDDGGTITVGTAPDYTTSNVETDREFDADSTSTAELADVLGTLIADLISLGILQ